jgi:hypothetical protein
MSVVSAQRHWPGKLPENRDVTSGKNPQNGDFTAASLASWTPARIYHFGQIRWTRLKMAVLERTLESSPQGAGSGPSLNIRVREGAL